MSHGMSIQKLLKPFEVMSLITLQVKSFYHMKDHVVIISPHFVVRVFLRPEITCDAKLVRTGDYHGRGVVGHSLGNGDLSLESLLFFAVKMDKSAHGVKKPPGDGKAKPQTSGEAAASRIRLIKVIKNMGDLGTGHADSGVADIYDQVDPVAFFSILDTYVESAFFCELDGIFQKNLKNMGNFFHVADEDRRYLGIQIKDHFQLMFAALHGCHGNDVIEQGIDHVGFFGRGQSAFHDLRIVQHVINLVGQAFTCHLYGIHVCPDLRRNILFQYDFADSQNHVDGSPELMGHIGEKLRVLPPGRLQFHKSFIILLPCFQPSVNPVYCYGHGAGNYGSAHTQPCYMLHTHSPGDGM